MQCSRNELSHDADAEHVIKSTDIGMNDVNNGMNDHFGAIDKHKFTHHLIIHPVRVLYLMV